MSSIQQFADLAANRAGRLTEAQCTIVEQHIARQKRSLLLGIALGIGTAALILTGLYRVSTVIAVFVIGMNAVALPLFVWLWRRKVREVREDLAEGRVLAVTGIATTTAKGQLMIGEQTFAAQKSLENIAIGSIYTAYYTPRSRLIVGIEEAGPS